MVNTLIFGENTNYRHISRITIINSYFDIEINRKAMEYYTFEQDLRYRYSAEN